MPQGHGRDGPWSAEMDFDVGQQQVVQTLWDGAWQCGLADGCFVYGLGGLGARQCWATVMMICCVGHWASWCWQNAWPCVSGLMAVT